MTAGASLLSVVMLIAADLRTSALTAQRQFVAHKNA